MTVEHLQDRAIGFLGMFENLGTPGYIAALLVLDDKGIPLEFRCTQPICPTPVQKTLYGSVLEPHLGASVCGLPLLSAVSNSLSLVFVNKEYFLELRKQAIYPFLFLERSSKKSSTGSPNKDLKEATFLAHPNFPEDIDRVISMIRLLPFTLEEPFQRIAQALEILVKKEPKLK